MFSATLNLFRVKETRNKILFTLFGIFLFRVGSYLPVPGVDADVLKSQDASGLFGIFNTFAGLIKKYDIEPSNLKIEITETTIMSDVPNLMGELEELRKAGFTLEIDDFGSGYSSLNT